MLVSCLIWNFLWHACYKNFGNVSSWYVYPSNYPNFNISYRLRNMIHFVSLRQIKLLAVWRITLIEQEENERHKLPVFRLNIDKTRIGSDTFVHKIMFASQKLHKAKKLTNPYTLKKVSDFLLMFRIIVIFFSFIAS